MSEFGGCRGLGTKDWYETQTDECSSWHKAYASSRIAQICAVRDAHAELTEPFFFRGGVEAKMRREGSP